MRKKWICLLLTLSVVSVLLCVGYFTNAFQKIANFLGTLGPGWALALANGIVTTVLVIVAALEMMETRKMRIESARPNLSIQPADYYVGGNFGSLHLVNGGDVARDMDIDVMYKNQEKLLYISSIGTSERVPILHGNFPVDGGTVEVQVRFKDAYGRENSENLSLDFDSLAKEKRKFTYVLSPLDVIARKLDRIEQKLSDIERKFG